MAPHFFVKNYNKKQHFPNLKIFFKQSLNTKEMFNIPQEHLPDFAKDEERLNVLFAPFRNRNVNAKDFDSKISSWVTLIELYCTWNNIFTFTLTGLNENFIRKGRPPRCLEEVLKHMVLNGDLQVLEEYYKNNNGWTGWITDTFIKKPFNFAWVKVKSAVIQEHKVENYVHLPVIKSKSLELLNLIPERFRNKLISLEHLLEISQQSNNEKNVKILLHHLLSQKKIDLKEIQDNNKKTLLIKFGDGQEVKPISEVDLAIFTLEKNEETLRKNLETLEDETQSLIQEAKEHLSKKRKQLAKNCLRKRNDLEKRVAKKANSLHNIQILLERIKDSHGDAHVFESYKKAISAFDVAFKQSGLSEDSVDETMIKLGETLDLQQDLSRSLAQSPVADLESESDLERELEDLIKEDENNPDNNGGNVQEVQDLLGDLDLNLPDVPLSPVKLPEQTMYENN